jgi:hypothetical protein
MAFIGTLKHPESFAERFAAGVEKGQALKQEGEKQAAELLQRKTDTFRTLRDANVPTDRAFEIAHKQAFGLLEGVELDDLSETERVALDLKKSQVKRAEQDIRKGEVEIEKLQTEKDIKQFELGQQMQILTGKLLGKDQRDQANILRKDFETSPTFKEAELIQTKAANMESAYARAVNPETKDLNAADQALIISFNKMLDPTSAVKESEYARTPAGQAFVKSAWGRAQQLTAGGSGLTNESRLEMLKMSRDFKKNSDDFLKEKAAHVGVLADNFGIDRKFIFGNLFAEEEAAQQEAVAQEQAAQQQAAEQQQQTEAAQPLAKFSSMAEFNQALKSMAPGTRVQVPSEDGTLQVFETF